MWLSLLCKPGHVSSGLYLVSHMVIPRPWHVIAGHVISAANIARSILTVLYAAGPCNYIPAYLDHMQWYYVTMLPWLAHTVTQCHMPCNMLHYTCLALKSPLIATSTTDWLMMMSCSLDDIVPMPKYGHWDGVTWNSRQVENYLEVWRLVAFPPPGLLQHDGGQVAGQSEIHFIDGMLMGRHMIIAMYSAVPCHYKH